MTIVGETDWKDYILTFSTIFILLTVGAIVGVFVDNYFSESSQLECIQNDLNNSTNFDVLGLYMNYKQNWSVAMDTAHNYSSSGNWICINLKYANDYNQTINTIRHEIGHELFAQYCAKEENFDKCINLTQ